MNGTVLNPGYELGRDNASGYLSQNTTVHNKFARDVVGYTLGYFNGDYQSIGSTNFAPSPYGVTALNTAISQLYNGNIAYTTTAIADVPSSGTTMGIQMGVYRYDQLNRLVGARTFRASGLAASNSWSGAAETQEHTSTYSYDGNGNLTHLLRNGGASNLNMDNFTYNFESIAGKPSNRLDYVDDITGNTGNYTDDIDDQSSDNYGYDKLGQLILDNSEGSMQIEWYSGNRKVKKITRTGQTIEFKYSPLGQRILKKATNTATGAVTTTYYVYDANGQVMGVYNVNLTVNDATLSELNIYGASRLGMIDRDIPLVTAGTVQIAPVYPPADPAIHILGYKKYEITNYLGNVHAVISDRKLYISGTYEAVVIMNSDYYPFGMEMPGRHTDEGAYRFGYNGMEMDNEAKGNGNSYTTEFRQYDPRLGRWLSLDPLKSKYPWMSPYVAFNDNPIYYTDPLGLEGDPKPREEPREKNYPKENSNGNGNTGGQVSNFLKKLGSVMEPPRTYTKVSQEQHNIWKSQQRVSSYNGQNSSSVDKNDAGQYFLRTSNNKEKLGTGDNLWNYGAPMMYQVEGNETTKSGGQTHPNVYLLEPIRMKKRIPTDDGFKSEPIEMRAMQTVKRKAPEIQNEINKKVKDLINQGYKPEDIEIKFNYMHNWIQGDQTDEEFNNLLNRVYGSSIAIFNQLNFGVIQSSGGFVGGGNNIGATLFVNYEIIVTKSVEEYSYE